MSPVLTSAQIREALELDGAGGDGRRYTSVSVDSRTADEGALFFALSGERHHGFDFLAEAAGRGVRGAVIPSDREPPAELDLEWFAVEEPREALKRLGAWARRRTDARVVAITGSSGKTTVKEMLAAALEEALSVHRTSGNLNSLVGLPLAVLEAAGDEDVWVLELGSNRPGEIAELTEIAAPDDAVVTTVGPAHLEGFGDLDSVLDEKLDLVRGADPRGFVVVGELPPELPRAARAIRSDTVVAGLGNDAEYRPSEHDRGPDWVIFQRHGVRFRVHAGGEHHLRDALLAAAAAEALGVNPELASAGLASFQPLGMRGSLRRLDGVSVVADCYNANPESFDAAIRYCASSFPDRRLVAAVGSMLELGERSPEEHRRVASKLLEAGFSTIVATGEFVAAFQEVAEAGDVAADGTRVLAAEDAGEAADRLAGLLEGDEVVLVKGSRGARLEAVVERLEQEFGEDAARDDGDAAASGGRERD